MKTNRTSRALRNIGLPLATAGLIMFTAPSISEASELGNKVLQEGMNSEQVHTLQELLIEKGLLDNTDINGVYDTSTSEAITAFQKKHHLIVDGMAGLQTLGALTVLSEGDKGVLVEGLQERLLTLGYYKGNKDGIFGPLTHHAVISFQASQGIGVDGIAGPETYASLYNYSTNRALESESIQDEKNEQSESTQAEVEAAAPVPVQVEEAQASTDHAPAENNQATFEMEATAYTAYCDGCSGITATGMDLRNNPNKKVIAVDPNVIPLGTRVHVEGYGEAIAGDTGGAIQGHKVDLHFPTKEEAIQFGRQTVTVTIIQ